MRRKHLLVNPKRGLSFETKDLEIPFCSNKNCLAMMKTIDLLIFIFSPSHNKHTIPPERNSTRTAIIQMHFKAIRTLGFGRNAINTKPLKRKKNPTFDLVQCLSTIISSCLMFQIECFYTSILPSLLPLVNSHSPRTIEEKEKNDVKHVLLNKKKKKKKSKERVVTWKLFNFSF